MGEGCAFPLAHGHLSSRSSANGVSFFAALVGMMPCVSTGTRVARVNQPNVG